MPKAAVAVPRKRRKKRALKAASGYVGARSRVYRSANETLMRAANYGRAGRHIKKRDYRAMWVVRLAAACMVEGITYSRLIDGLKKAGITLNRKMLTEIAIADPAAFTLIADKAKKALGV